MAAAQVTGAAVLLASARRDLGWEGMRTALLGSARPTSLPVAAGRLDVAGALRRVLGARRRALAGERQARQRGPARNACAALGAPGRRARAPPLRDSTDALACIARVAGVQSRT